MALADDGSAIDDRATLGIDDGLNTPGSTPSKSEAPQYVVIGVF